MKMCSVVSATSGITSYTNLIGQFQILIKGDILLALTVLSKKRGQFKALRSRRQRREFTCINYAKNSTMHALVEWTDEEKVSVISLTRVKEPRKDFGLYNLGEVVKASCHGFPGVHSAKILSIRGNENQMDNS